MTTASRIAYVPVIDQIGVEKPLLKWRRELKARLEEHLPSTWSKELVITLCVVIDTWNPPRKTPVYWPDDTLDSWYQKLADRFRALLDEHLPRTSQRCATRHLQAVT